MNSIESVLISTLTFINPYHMLLGFKSPENAGKFIVLVCCAAAI